MNYNDPFATAQYGAQTSAAAYDAGLRSYMLKIYNYMASALVLTGIFALVFAKISVGIDPATGQQGLTQIGHSIYVSPLKWVIMFAPLGLVMWLGFGINRLSTGAAQAIFWAYSALLGLSLSSIFLMYTGESIARTFFITAGTFGAMSIYGYTTKRDLSGFGSFLMMGLIGLIIASLVNLFMQSSALSFATSVIGVFIFVGLTAYDTQKMKSMYYQVAGSSEMIAKTSIIAALNLYMDFINLFLHLLRFIGDRR